MARFNLPTLNSVAPTNIAELVEIVRQAHAAQTPLYPIGGGTSLEFGLAPSDSGTAIEMRSLSKVIDYPYRDMTITVEAGITMQALAEILAEHKQQLPIDVPRAAQATLGGVVATGWSGPRRYGHGTIRDYAIGIAAVDGRGRLFHGGGRVVKNVAGYDMCKLLTGSLGTLGIVTEVTLKLKPLAETTLWLIGGVALKNAEEVLSAFIHAPATPAAIELLAGQAWRDDAMLGPMLSSSRNDASPPEHRAAIAVALEGSPAETDWMAEQLQRQWGSMPIDGVQVVRDEGAMNLSHRLTEGLPVQANALAAKASVLPSRAAQFIETLLQFDPQANVQAHAGNGIVLAQCLAWPAHAMGRAVISQLRPAAAAAGGNLLVLAAPPEAALTHQAVWGAGQGTYGIMTEVKRAFDPANILNRGRFVYLGGENDGTEK